MSKLRLGSEYIPLTNEEMSKIRVVISFSWLALFTVAVPFLAFIFCVIWSILYNFEHSNATHCKVYNFLPSVSASIGHYRPQKDVWKIAIAIQAVVRTLAFTLYYRYYNENIYRWAKGIKNVVLVTYAVENISLVTLSYWTSNENYAFHKFSFITFLLTSFVHMILAYYLMRNCRNITNDRAEVTALKWKWRTMLINILSILLACYFFYRHNKYCEPIVYSMFALSEYGVVLSNMAYHMTTAWDFVMTRIMISSNGIRII